jgi:flap endonuclease-1
MGVKYLKRYIRNNCNSGARQIQLERLRGKKIAVDVSIYLYRYKSNEGLMEGMFSLISTLFNDGIIPVFIFDGPPKANKAVEIANRRKRKSEAWEQYKSLDKKDTVSMSNNELANHTAGLKNLKSQCIRISPTDTANVKELIDFMGCTWIDAPHEADEVCAMLVKSKQVYAVLSEDMDMFLYGCAHILCYLSIVHRTVLLYDLKVLLKELSMTHEEFKQVCVISGTDYNTPSPKNLYFYMEQFKRYQRSKKRGKSADYYEWIMDNHPTLIDDHTELLKTYFVFDLQGTEYDYLKKFDKVIIKNREPQMDKLEELLLPEDFMFVH